MPVKANPAWTNRALLDHWDQIERAAGPGLLPRVTSRSAGRLVAQEYGSGAYGTVLPSRRKGWVVKITSDPSEAKFAFVTGRMAKRPTGLVRYGKTFQLRGRHSGRPIYILWREEAYRVGEIVDDSPAGQLAAEQLDAIRQNADFSFRLMYSPDLIEQNRAAILEAEKTYANRTGYEAGGSPGALKRLSLNFASRVERAGYGIDAAWEIADQMSKGSVLPNVGRAIRDLIDRGIVLADVHLGNIGYVKRDGRFIDAITDPGNSVFLTQKFDRLQVPSLVRTGKPSGRPARSGVRAR